MSREYDLYLEQHRENVANAYYWLKHNLPEVIACWDEEENLEYRICNNHDRSKDKLDEYDAYDKYFYGNNRSYDVVQDFNRAWLKHIHRNPHHWQYWVLINDNPNEGEIILDMPYGYIIEMLCDWWAFSFASDNLREIFNWFDVHSSYMKLSEETRKAVTIILAKIDAKLDELENSKESED